MLDLTTLLLFAAALAVTAGSLGPSIVDLTRITPAGWAGLVAVMLAVLVAVDLVWALAADRARRLLKSPRAMRLANRVSAGTMSGAAAAMAAR